MLFELENRCKILHTIGNGFFSSSFFFFFEVLFAASFFFIKKSGSVRFNVQHFFSGDSVAKCDCRCEWLEFWLRLRML